MHLSPKNHQRSRVMFPTTKFWTILTLFLFGPLSPVAAAEERPDRLSPMDIFDLELAADPQISPDGSVIVYVRHFCDVKTDQRYSNLWTVDFDGANHRPAGIDVLR